MFFDISTLSPDILNAIGVAGFMLYVLSYGFLTLRVVTGDSLTYFTLNLLAAGMVLMSLAANYNMASVLIQVFWIGISIVGISLRLMRGGVRAQAT